MGCRPSKQATSKVRAVEHKEDFRCSCSPRKIRKHHKCASGSNISRRISAGSGRGSSKQSLSSSHKPRSSKSADLDFPAFSTTTAVYRTSASKTSKITLRLSCDGSTLEIEQCDYDLEKVRGEGESKPRPWNSAPNLTKMRDGKSRLFRDSCLPIKHSKSGWSPSFVSPTCSNRGGLFHTPVQVNTPDDSLCSSGNISGYSFSVFSQGGSSYRDKNSMYQAFESSTFAGKSFGKTSVNKSNTSSKCSSGDERRPLLLDILKESHKKSSLEGNINPASSAASMENAYKDRTQTCSSLDNMINELETSLAMVHRASCSSVPHTSRPFSLNTIQVDSVDIHKPDGSCCPDFLEVAPITCRACPSPGIEHIPVNVISSFITCQGRPVTCVECDRNFCPLIPSPDVYFSGDQKQDQNTTMTFDPQRVPSLADKPHPQCLTVSNQANTVQISPNDIFKKDISTFIFSDGVLGSALQPTLQNATETIPDVNQISLHFAPSIDPNSIIHLDTQDCSTGNKNPSFFLSTVDKPSGSLVAREQGSSCLTNPRQVFELGILRPELDRSNLTDRDSVFDCRENVTCRNNHTKLQFQVQNTFNNLSQDGGDKAGYRRGNHGEFSGRTFTSNSPHDTTSGIFPGAQNCCSDARCAQITGIEFCENESGIRHGENLPSSVEVIDGAVRENYIILHQNKQGDGRTSDDEWTTFSRFPIPDSIYFTQQKSQEEEKTRQENLELHRINNRQTIESGISKQVQVCNECMTEISNESINSNLNLIKKSSQSGGFSHRLNGNTSLSQEINDCPWEVLHTLDLVQANERKTSLSNSNLEFGRQSSNEMKHLNIDERHDADRFSEDAGYLLGLLFPEGANFIAPLNSNTRFSFDFEYLDESETTCSSNSDSSDNEISPLCYSLLGQQASCENYLQNLNSQLRDTPDTDIDPAITSMQSVREVIVYQRLAMMDPCVTVIEDRCADLQNRPDLTSERNSLNSGLHSIDSKSCSTGFPRRAHTRNFPLLEPCPLLAKMENSITPTSNVIHGNAQGNSQRNDSGTKQEIMILGGDISAPNYSARISPAGRDSPKHQNTDSEVCKNLSLAQLSCTDTDTNSFHSLLPFSETSETTGEKLLGFSSTSDVTRDQRRQVGPTSGQILIQELTSGPCYPAQDPGRRHTEQIINTADQHLVDKTLACVVNSPGHAIADNEWDLEKLGSKIQAASNKEEDGRVSRDNEIRCSVEGRFSSQESLGYTSPHELCAINSSIRAHLCDVDMGKNRNSVNDKAAILAKGMQFLLSNCQRQIDRLNNNSNIDDEYATSLSSLSNRSRTAVNAGVISTDNTNHTGTARIERDIDVSGNNQVECIEETASNHGTMFSERSGSCCYLQRHEGLLSEHAKQVVSCQGTASVQQIPSIRSEISASQPPITNTEVQSRSPSQSISYSLAVVSSTKTINGKQSFHKQYHLLDRLCPGQPTGSNATSESRSSTELGSVYLGSQLSSDSSKLSGNSSQLACLVAASRQDGDFIQGSSPAKCPLILGIPSASSENVFQGILDNVSHEQIGESLQMPRNNVLSLVRYFEKVPYTRRETKQ